MKKKILGVAFCIIAAVMLFCVFAGCSRTASGGEKGTLELNKKYIHESDVRLDETVQRYFNFISADEGKYHYYAVSPLNDKMIYSYTITFHYKIVGEMVNCFFDSVEYDTVDTEKNASTGWSYTLGADVDFLLQTNGIYYINEDYLKEIPNFDADDANT